MRNFPLRTLKFIIQKRFLSTPTSITSSQSSFTVQFLINSCGLSSKSALLTSQKLKIDETSLQNPNLVLKFLKSNGLDNAQIAKLVEKHPAILQSRVGSNLLPKWDYFMQNGYNGKLLAELVISNPNITGRSLHDQIKPSFEYLKEILGSNENVIKAVTRSSWLLTYNLKSIFKPSVDLMIKGGVPLSSIAKLIVLNPRALMQSPENFARDFTAVKKLGLDPEAPSFIHALRVMVQMSESTLLKKVKMFKSLGWTQQDILSMLRKNPFCFASSEEKIRSSMDFFVNTVKVKPEILFARPLFLNFGLDKMRRRFNFLKILESKMLLKWDETRVAYLLIMNEKTFLKYYVDKYKNDIPGLEKMYLNAAAKTEKLDS
ncbi:hypothetical protein ACFE04_001607 [Oxalis oulophora]